MSTELHGHENEVEVGADSGTLSLIGLIAGHALRAHMKSKRKSPVADVIDEWNRVRRKHL